MKKLILLPLLIIFLYSCTRKVTPPPLVPTYTKFKTLELIADNISENMSGNDEIHLMILLIKDSLSKAIILKEWNDSLIFKTYDSTLSINTNCEKNFSGLLKDNYRFIFLLMEIDTDKSMNERTKKIKDFLAKTNYQNYDSLKIHLNRVIQDDDLLDLNFYNVSHLYKFEEGAIIFNGVNVFDKYYYRLKYKWE
jgi:hypothetical protein